MSAVLQNTDGCPCCKESELSGTLATRTKLQTQERSPCSKASLFKTSLFVQKTSLFVNPFELLSSFPLFFMISASLGFVGYLAFILKGIPFPRFLLLFI